MWAPLMKPLQVPNHHSHPPLQLKYMWIMDEFLCKHSWLQSYQTGGYAAVLITLLLEQKGHCFCLSIIVCMHDSHCDGLICQTGSTNHSIHLMITATTNHTHSSTQFSRKHIMYSSEQLFLHWTQPCCQCAQWTLLILEDGTLLQYPGNSVLIIEKVYNGQLHHFFIVSNYVTFNCSRIKRERDVCQNVLYQTLT